MLHAHAVFRRFCLAAAFTGALATTLTAQILPRVRDTLVLKGESPAAARPVRMTPSPARDARLASPPATTTPPPPPPAPALPTTGTVTVYPKGTGSGMVTSSRTGIACRYRAGAAPSGTCTATFPAGGIYLVSTPDSGTGPALLEEGLGVNASLGEIGMTVEAGLQKTVATTFEPSLPVPINRVMVGVNFRVLQSLSSTGDGTVVSTPIGIACRFRMGGLLRNRPETTGVCSMLVERETTMTFKTTAPLGSRLLTAAPHVFQATSCGSPCQVIVTNNVQMDFTFIRN